MAIVKFVVQMLTIKQSQEIISFYTMTRNCQTPEWQSMAERTERGEKIIGH